jgi:ribonucleoside-diphosphate reductase alpha chain
MDNVIDKTRYPTPAQEAEQKSKRRVGVGVTGMADAIHAMGAEYGSDEYLYLQDRILETLRNECYAASIELASRKGAFPLFDRDKFLMGENIKKLPEHLQEGIYKHGIRNGTCNSIAPTGTISLFGDNVSSGIEPPFSIRQTRIITRGNGVKDEVELLNYAFMAFGVVGTCADEVTATQHVDVLTRAQYWIDQAVSKTCNIGDEVTEEEFSDIYMRAYKSKAKGCTTFRASGYRKGILKSLDTNGQDGAACMYDPTTGEKTCS